MVTLLTIYGGRSDCLILLQIKTNTFICSEETKIIDANNVDIVYALSETMIKDGDIKNIDNSQLA